MRTAAVPLLLLAALSAWAGPEDEDVDDDRFLDDSTVIVYQPDGTPRVAGSAHVIDEEELETFSYDDIGKVLNQTPGVYIRGEDGFGLRPNIGMRGANSDRSAKITLLEDGVPLVPAPYGAPAAYYFPMTQRITGVEVFKGAASTAHGPQTVGGAINLLTRAVPDDGAIYRVDLAAGTFGTARLHAYGGWGTERGGVLAEVSHLQTDGFKQIDGSDAGTGFSRSDVMFKGRLATDPARSTRHAVELKLGWGNEGSNETYLGLHRSDFEDDPDRRYVASSLARMEWTRTQAELSHQLDSGAFRLRTTAYHHGIQRAWNKFNGFVDNRDPHTLFQQDDSGTAAIYLGILRGTEDTVTNGQRLRIGVNDRNLQASGVQSTATWRLRGDRVDSQLEAGLRLHHDLVRRRHTETPYDMFGGALSVAGAEYTTLDSVTTATAIAAHVHEDLAIGDLHLLPGVRSETIRTTSRLVTEEHADAVWRTTFLPGFALLQEATGSTQLFGGVHRGFSPVSPGQAPEVRPESSVNVEAGLRTDDGQRHAELVGYFNRYTNITGQCTLSGGCLDQDLDAQFNGGRAWVYGAEAVAGIDLLLPGRITVPVTATYTLSLSEFRTGFVSGFPQFGVVSAGDRLPQVPLHQGGLRVGVDHERFGVDVNIAGRSGMRDAAGQGPLTDDDIPAQVLVDVAVHLPLSNRLEAYGMVNNLANTRTIDAWRPFGARPNAPRQLLVGVQLAR